MPDDLRDPELPGRLLTRERDALMPLLRRTGEDAFDLRTACPDWSVREVIAHCAAALSRVVEGRLGPGVFTPESNAADVRERADWPLSRLLDSLEQGMTDAGPVMAAREDGAFDGIAFGEWVHAGDMRDALGEPGAYGGDQVEQALVLLGTASRRKSTPRVHAVLPSGTLDLGVEVEGRDPARLTTDAPTLIRLYTDRPLVGTRYELTGARPEELRLY
jgi:uncharacterized protein (TIGR03083 family)